MAREPILRESPLSRLIADSAAVGARPLRGARLVEVERIRPNPEQPRRSLNPKRLKELADSIAQRGVLQPVVVRAEGEGYILVAGERRWRAAQMAGLKEIPALIRDTPAAISLEESLVENLQRENLDPLEEALCYHELRQRHSYSYRQLAALVHKNVAYIDSRLKLIKYPELAEAVKQFNIPVFEARELAKVADEARRRELTRRVAARELSRAALMQAVRQARGLPPPATPPPRTPVEGLLELGERFKGELLRLPHLELSPQERRRAQALLREILLVLGRALMHQEAQGARRPRGAADDAFQAQGILWREGESPPPGRAPHPGSEPKEDHDVPRL